MRCGSNALDKPVVDTIAQEVDDCQVIVYFLSQQVFLSDLLTQVLKKYIILIVKRFIFYWVNKFFSYW